jgi:hypothetical protein
LSLNWWTKALKPVVPGRIEAQLPLPDLVKRLKLEHLPRGLFSIYCYVQLVEDDLHMLVVPHVV